MKNYEATSFLACAGEVDQRAGRQTETPFEPGRPHRFLISTGLQDAPGQRPPPHRIPAASVAAASVFRIARDGEIAGEARGRGQPVVLIHGWALDRRAWAHQVSAFARHFRTITYDRRGFGESTSPPSLEQELLDLDAILDRLQIDRVALVGMSQGGRIALRYARTRPHRVRALVLQSAPLDGHQPPTADRTMLPVERYADLLRAGDRAAFVRELAAHPLLDPGEKYPAVREEVLEMLRTYRGDDLLSYAVDDWGTGVASDAWLRKIAVRTLVLTGARETLWLRWVADYTASRIRGAQRRVLRGGGHLVNMTNPGDYNACVIEFLKRATTPASGRA